MVSATRRNFVKAAALTPALISALDQGALAEATAPQASQSTVAARYGYVVVDDEQLVHAGTSDMLTDLRYEVSEASAALAYLDRDPEVSGVMTDHLVPCMTGTLRQTSCS